MAQARSLDNAQFWLPHKFLTGDDLLVDKRNCIKNGKGEVVGLGGSPAFPTEFHYEFDSLGFNSARSSPVESVMGSTETESSDEEDFLYGLNRCLAQSSLNGTHKLGVPSFSKDKPKGNLARSPQSTLSGIGSWSGKSMFLSNGFPAAISQVPSPTTSPFRARNDNWDLVYAAAGQVTRTKLNSDGAIFGYNHNTAHLGSNYNVSVSSLRNPYRGSLTNPVHTHTLPQFQQVRVDQSVRQHSQCCASMGMQVKIGLSGQHISQNHQQIQNRGRNIVYESGSCMHPLKLSQTTRLPLHVQHQKHQIQQNVPRTSRPGLLCGSVVKRECAGTGVFIPRRHNNPPELRKKAGCSNVVIPRKVESVHINFGDSNGHAHPPFVNGFSQNHEAMLARRNEILVQQRRILRPERAVIPEIRLPQDWTY